MCVPVGGLSIIGSPTPLASFNSDLPLILVSASMDSRSLVPDLAVGAESAISGVITLLAVVDALSQVSKMPFLIHFSFIPHYNLNELVNCFDYQSTCTSCVYSVQWRELESDWLQSVLPRPQLFHMFTAWEWRMHETCPSVPRLSKIALRQDQDHDWVGSTGLRFVISLNCWILAFCLSFHTLLGIFVFISCVTFLPFYSDRTTTNQVFGFSKPQPSGSPDFIADLNTQSSPQDPNAIPPQFRASSLPNTLPPASLSSLLSWRPNTAHLYLSNHDTQFTNPYFHSPWDDGGDASSFTNTSRHICGIASAIARTVHSYASSSAVPAGVVANCTLVRELYECLVRQFGCPLVASLINLNGNATRLSHYAGLYQFDQTNAYTTFLYHFMWTRLSDPSFSGGTCKTTSNCVEKTPGVGFRSLSFSLLNESLCLSIFNRPAASTPSAVNPLFDIMTPMEQALNGILIKAGSLW